MFVWYSEEHKGFLLYDSTEGCLRISRNVIFVLNDPFLSLRPATHLTQVSYLPHFLEFRSPPLITKNYVQQPLPLPPAAPNLNHLSLLAPPPPSKHPLHPLLLQRSGCLSKAPDRYGFSMLPTHIDHVPMLTSYSLSSKVPCCQDSMTEKLLALEANTTWDVVHLLVDASIISSKNGFTPSTLLQIGVSTDTELDLWLKDSNSMVLIIKKHLHLSLKWVQFILYPMLLLCANGLLSRWTWRMPFWMVIFGRMTLTILKWR